MASDKSLASPADNPPMNTPPSRHSSEEIAAANIMAEMASSATHGFTAINQTKAAAPVMTTEAASTVETEVDVKAEVNVKAESHSNAFDHKSAQESDKENARPALHARPGKANNASGVTQTPLAPAAADQSNKEAGSNDTVVSSTPSRIKLTWNNKERDRLQDMAATPKNRKTGDRRVNSAPTRGVKTPSSGKRSRDIDDLGDDSDSEIELSPMRPYVKIKGKVNGKDKTILKKVPAPKAPASKKKTKMTLEEVDHDYHSDGDDQTPAEDVDMAEVPIKTEEPKDEQLTLWQPTMKRSERIVNEKDPNDAELIARAIEAGMKVGDEVYDSELEEMTGNVKNVAKAELFRNVNWGDAAFETETDDWEDTMFTQFVPGRWERMPGGELRDQKAKLVVRLTDKDGRRRIFQNPPPRDWKNQEALTALNKRVVQQIRRNTNIRFRPVVRPYLKSEREWILKQLNSGAKPKKGWRRFVDEFNDLFGEKPDEAGELRPKRSHSSLTKEVERFAERFYKKGLIPEPIPDDQKRKVGAKRRAEADAAVDSKATASKKRKTI